MRKKSYLILAGSVNFFIALVHIIALFVGAAAYDFLDAPQLAFYAEMGSSIPFCITLFTIFFFMLFGLYAFYAAGSKIKLPMQNKFIVGIGYVFLARGLCALWFMYLYVKEGTFSSLKEIGFSLIALAIGGLYLYGNTTEHNLFNA